MDGINKISESAIETFAIELLEKLGYQYVYAPDIAPDKVNGGAREGALGYSETQERGRLAINPEKSYYISGFDGAFLL